MEKGQSLQQIVLFQMAVSMQKNAYQSFPILVYKTQVQIDQRPPHKTRYTETIRSECGKELRTHRHRGKFTKQNINGLCFKIKNQKMAHHEITKFL